MKPNGLLFYKEKFEGPRESEKTRAKLSKLMSPNCVNPKPRSVQIRAKSERCI